MRIASGFADDDLPRERYLRQQAEIPRYAQIEAAAKERLAKTAVALESGAIGHDEFMMRGRQIMQESETDAFVSGRRVRGDNRPDLAPAEERMLNGRNSRNMRYWANFGRDILTGRGRMDYGARAGMYAESLWSVFTRGETSDWNDPELQNARYHWILDPEAEHCPDCLARAKECRDIGGYTWEQLAEKGWPGEQTRCMTKCRCHIRVERKRRALPERFEDARPSSTPDSGRAVLEQILGGPELPLRLPAAGIPYAKITPNVVAQAGDALARLLPTLPSALTKPAILHGGWDTRHYVGESGLAATLTREEGIWRIIALFIVPELFDTYWKAELADAAMEHRLLAQLTSKFHLAEIRVEGYTRKDGTKVEGYTKSIEDHPEDEKVTKERVMTAARGQSVERAMHMDPVRGQSSGQDSAGIHERRKWAREKLQGRDSCGKKKANWGINTIGRSHLKHDSQSAVVCDVIQNLDKLADTAQLALSVPYFGANQQVELVLVYANKLQIMGRAPVAVEFIVQVRMEGHHLLYSLEGLDFSG